MSVHPRSVPAARLAAAVLLTACGLVATSPRLSGRAAAAVTHGDGFEATVKGWTSWYGSYRLEGVGRVWCVDHGLSAPDTVDGYVDAALDDHAADTRRALAWAVGRWGASLAGDRAGSAALMLVLHDLMGAHYPTGVLDLDRLDPGELDGFGASASAILEQARRMRGDAIAHSGLQPPLALTASVDAGAGAVVVRAMDATGTPVAGLPIRVNDASGGTSDGLTTAEGTWSAAAAPPASGERTFHATAAAPDLALHSMGPTRAHAQRIAVPSVAALEASASWPTETPPPLPAPPARHLLTIVKTGDDTAYLPITGARFAIHDREVGAGEPVALDAGRHTVTEITPPAGYSSAGPWEVDLSTADATLTVNDRAVRGSLSLAKVDALNDRPVAGAVVRITFDADHDGSFETPAGEVTTADAPVTVTGLLPGDYQVAEASAPPGYAPNTVPVAATVAPGAVTNVAVRDTPLASIVFAKSPAVAGAVFALTGTDAVEAGRCTTGDDGRCTIAGPSLLAGRRYCWSEPVAPAGFAAASPACLEADAGDNVVAVAEPALPAPLPAPAPPAPAPAPAAAAPPVPPPPVAPPPVTLVVAAAAPPPAAPTPAETTTPRPEAPVPPAAPLPLTGANATPAMVGTGLALLVTGAVALFLGRRSRRRPPG